jgi:hypothetical protein
MFNRMKQVYEVLLHLLFSTTFAHCFTHNNDVPAASSNSVTSGGSVSSRIAATMSGGSLRMHVVSRVSINLNSIR